MYLNWKQKRKHTNNMKKIHTINQMKSVNINDLNTEEHH